jgi:hypothetical protein
MMESEPRLAACCLKTTRSPGQDAPPQAGRLVSPLLLSCTGVNNDASGPLFYLRPLRPSRQLRQPPCSNSWLALPLHQLRNPHSG